MAEQFPPLCNLARRADDIRSSSFVCCILPTAFVIVLSWVERRWAFSVIGCVFQLRHAEKKGAAQPVAPQQLLWLWVLWVQLWVLGTDSDSDSE